MERLEKWFGLRTKGSSLTILPSDSDPVSDPADQETRADNQTSGILLIPDENSGFKLSNILRMSKTSKMRGMDLSAKNTGSAPSVEQNTEISNDRLSLQDDTSPDVNVNNNNKLQPNSDYDNNTALIPENDRTKATESSLVDESAASTIQSESLEEDCVQCRVIGSAVGIGTAAFVFRHGWQSQSQYTGYKRILFQGQFISLATAMVILSTCVAFKLSIFKPLKEGEERTVAGLLKEDCEMLKDKFSRLFSLASSK